MPMEFQGNGSYGGAQVPFRRTIEPSALGMYVALEQRDMERLRRYEQNWKFYLGQQWAFGRDDGEPLVTINLLRTIVDKNVTWLTGNGMNFDVPEKLTQAILPHLNEVWYDLNAGDEIIYETGLMGSVTGDAFLLITPWEPTEQARRAFPHVNTFIRVQLLGSEQVFPVWDPLDTTKMIAVKIITVYVDNTHMGQDPPRQAGPINTRRFTQVIYPDRIVEQADGALPVERPNVLGEIPLVHIRNLPIPREYYGLADVDGGLVDLQRELNEKATDVSDIVNYHAAPITVIVGAKVKNLERGAKKIWSGFPMGASVTNLEMVSDLPASMRYIEFIKTSMLETADLPETSLGRTPNISNTSGVALKMQNQPIVERIKRKRPYYEGGLEAVNYYILRWKQEMDGLRLPFGFCKHCGGRIIETLMFKDNAVRLDRFNRPMTRRRCFHADPLTGDFIQPEEMKIRFVRQFSFGAEIQEAERWKVAAYMLHDRKSFWDPLASVLDDGSVISEDELAAIYRKDRKEQTEGTAPKLTPMEQLARKLQPVRMPEGSIQVPSEPESVTVRRTLFDETTGLPLLDASGATQEEDVRLDLVPTDCEHPEFFNPLRIPVSLKDAMPHDEHLDMQLAVQATGAGLWSRRRGMKYVSVEDPMRELEDVEADRWTANAESPGDRFGGVGDDIAAAVPMTGLQGTEDQRQAANNGDANKSPPSGTPTMGKNQGGKR